MWRASTPWTWATRCWPRCPDAPSAQADERDPRRARGGDVQRRRAAVQPGRMAQDRRLPPLHGGAGALQGRLRYQDQDALAIVCGARTMALDPVWNGMTCPPNRAGRAAAGHRHMFLLAEAVERGGRYELTPSITKGRPRGRIAAAHRAPALPPGPPLARGGTWRPPASGPGCALARRTGEVGYSLASAYVPACGPHYLRCVRVAVTARCPHGCAHCEQLCAQRAALPEPAAEQPRRP